MKESTPKENRIFYVLNPWTGRGRQHPMNIPPETDQMPLSEPMIIRPDLPAEVKNRSF